MRRITAMDADQPGHAIGSHAGAWEAPEHRAPRGPLSAWIAGLSRRQRAALRDALLNDEAALASVIPDVFDARGRPARLVQLILEHASRAMGLSPGELAMLMPCPRAEALHALRVLTPNGGSLLREA